MIRIDTKVINGESLEQYLWRLGNNREALGLMWADVADLCNKAFKDDETEYITESAYRKKYQAAKKFYDEVFMREDFKADDIEETKRELFKLKQQLRDERTGLNAKLRAEARLDQNFNYLKEQLQNIGHINFQCSEQHVRINGDNSLVVMLSDLHLGECFDTAFGKYDSEIAKQRLDEYLAKIIDVGELHNATEVYVALLGDLLSGFPHLTVQLSNRENFIDQIKLVSEYLSSFIFELSKHFESVYVTGVAGNHSRVVQSKELAVKDERADSLCLWIIKQMLAHVKQIYIDTEIMDTTVTTMNVRGTNFVLTHGDYNEPTDASIGKLIMMLGYIPDVVLAGHKHYPYMREVNGIKFVQSGSLVGSGNDYCTQKRLSGKPNQTTLVVNDSGIDAIYNIELH